MAVTTIRPSGDVAGKSTHWKRSVGGALWVPLAADPASGSDYVYADAGMPTGVHWYSADLNGETITLGTRRVKWVQIRADIQNPGDVGRNIKVRTSVGDNATKNNITTPDYFYSTAAGSIVARNGQRHPFNPDGGQWNQGNLQRLRVEFYSYRSPNDYFVRLHRIFVDVDLRDQPTTTAVSLANTNTTRPQVSGTFTATEGDPLTRAWLKVFTAAQVAAAGFNPESSAATWSSGEQATTALKLDVGADLTPGVTYTAYLRGAYTLNGSPFWSAWVASSPFALAIDPAASPTLTATADTSLGRVILSAQGRTNLLSSDDADAEGTVGNWVSGTGMSAVDRSTAQAAHGTASVRMTATAVSNPEARNTGNSGAGAVTVDAGQVVAVNGRVRAAATGRAMRGGIRFHDAADAQVGSTTYGSTITDASGSWSTLPTVTATAPAGATRAYAVVSINATPAGGEIHYADQLQLVPGSTVPAWSPGGLADLSTMSIERWDRSIGQENVCRPELARGEAGWSRRTAGDTLTLDTSQAGVVGGQAVAWVQSATGSILDAGWPHGAFAEDYAIGGAAGLVAVVSFHARASTGGNYTAALDGYDAAGGSLGVVGSAVLALTTTRARFTITGTLAAGNAHNKLTVTNSTGATGRTVWIDGLQVELRAAGSSTTPDAWVPGQGTAPDWQPVRGASAWVPATGQLLAVSDFEVPPGWVSTYRGRVNTILAGLETNLASTDTATSTASVWLAPTGTWVVKDPYNPDRNGQVMVLTASEGMDPDVSVFQPAGLALPVAFWDAVGGKNAEITVLAMGDTEWARLTPILQAGSTMLIDLPEGGHRFFAIQRANWPRAGPLGQIQRAVSLSVAEVRRPPDV